MYFFLIVALSENINVERLTDLYDITRYQSNHIFHFAIIRYSLNPEIFDEELNFDQIRRQKSQITSTKKHDLFLMYPKESEKYDDSINFLSLAFSGIANINEKQSNLFIKDDENKNFLKNIFNQIKLKIDSSEEESGIFTYLIRL